MREVTIERNTNETQIELTLNLDGAGRYQVDTGCGFLNHMLSSMEPLPCGLCRLPFRGLLPSHCDRQPVFRFLRQIPGRDCARKLRRRYRLHDPT